MSIFPAETSIYIGVSGCTRVISYGQVRQSPWMLCQMEIRNSSSENNRMTPRQVWGNVCTQRCRSGLRTGAIPKLDACYCFNRRRFLSLSFCLAQIRRVALL
jgi:hypothetical protein